MSAFLRRFKFFLNLIFTYFAVFLICGFNFCIKVVAIEKKPLVVGIDIDFPPMGYVDESGERVGADIDFFRLAAKKMGREVFFQPINWEAKELELNSGKIDLICNGLSYTPERNESMLLTRPYMEIGQVVVVSKGSEIKNLSSLEGKAVCVQKSSSGEVALEKSSISSLVSQVVRLDSCVDCLNEVRQKKVDAAIVDESVARFYLNKEINFNRFEILNEQLDSEYYVIAVKKGNVDLKNEIENAYEQIANLKQTEQISKKWFGKQMFKMGQINFLSDGSKISEKVHLFENLSGGLLTTLKIFVLCLLFSIPLGLFICLVKFLKFKILNFFINFYIAVMRGTPLLLQLFFAFYGLPILFPGLVLKNRFLVGLIAFILNYAAYFAEIFRGGLNSINRGQFEAISILQIPKFKALRKIIIPQIMKICLPSICNETIALVKDTALIFSIGVVELLTVAKNLVNITADVSFYFVVAAIYFIICCLLNLIFDLIEKKLKFE